MLNQYVLLKKALGFAKVSSSYIKPLKADNSLQFQISVKNNRKDTCTVSLIKDYFGYVKSWISIDNNKQSLLPNQSKNFLITLKIPANTQEGEYNMFLNFNAAEKDGGTHSFTYDTQIITVDNSVPNKPTFSVSQTSNSITVSSWSSWDQFSRQYTLHSYDSGRDGIEKYTVALKTPSNTIKSKVIKATGATSYKFEKLQANTEYLINVTAHDMAGNANSTVKSTTMAPAPPKNLVFSKAGYTTTILSWDASAGATGYDVYWYKNGKNTKVNNKPISENSYPIERLPINKESTFNVIAFSGFGRSEKSANAKVKTLDRPKISGSSVICSDVYSCTVYNLLEDYSISWSNSANLKYLSTTGTTAKFKVINKGSASIYATIKCDGCNDIKLEPKTIWIGKPNIPSISGYRELGFDKLARYTSNSKFPGTWSFESLFDYRFAYIQKRSDYYCEIETKNTNGSVRLILNVDNVCGTSQNSLTFSVKGDSGGGLIPRSLNLKPSLSIYPNPATNNINIEFKNENQEDRYDYIYIYDLYYNLVLKIKRNANSSSINVSELKPGTYIIRYKELSVRFLKE